MAIDKEYPELNILKQIYDRIPYDEPLAYNMMMMMYSRSQKQEGMPKL